MAFLMVSNFPQVFLCNKKDPPQNFRSLVGLGRGISLLLAGAVGGGHLLGGAAAGAFAGQHVGVFSRVHATTNDECAAGSATHVPAPSPQRIFARK